jgi:hypothetical protein
VPVSNRIHYYRVCVRSIQYAKHVIRESNPSHRQFFAKCFFYLQQVGGGLETGVHIYIFNLPHPTYVHI